MNKLFASIAVILCLIAQAPVNAQDSRGAKPASRPSAQRPSGARAPSRAVKPTRSSRPQVAAASHEQIVEGEVYYEDASMGHSGGSSCESCHGGGCSSCQLDSGPGYCNTCAAPNRFCICFPSHGWVHAEYLLWYPDAMQTPSLVTSSTSGTARNAAGVLGQPTTSVLYGGDNVMDEDRSGFRIRFGWWLASFPNWGLEGEYVGLDEKTESFFASSSGSPILARPFFNSQGGREDAELVAFPSVIGGNIGVDVTSSLEGAAVRLRRQLCCSTGCGYSELCCQTVPTSSRLDGTVGYRFWELGESLMVTERLQSQLANDPGSFVITDRFETRNQFNGGELGFLWQGRRGWWSLDALMRLGIGNVHQTVTVAGSTAITENGVTTNHQGGVLAQRTNIGTYDRDQFTMVPELGVTLGYQMTRRLRATAGYSLVYFGNVVRPGDQVDLNVNPNLLPPEITPFTGPLRPQFAFNETDYWVQGLNFGGEFRW